MEVSSKDKKVTSWDNYPLISTADFYFFFSRNLEIMQCSLLDLL